MRVFVDKDSMPTDNTQNQQAKTNSSQCISKASLGLLFYVI